jgi:integrase
MSIKTHIAFDLQYHYGLRASEAILIQRSQLEPKTKILNIQGKGGYWRKIHLSSEIYSTIESELNTNGSYQINYMTYYDELKKAVIKRNEIWYGTHGLRYNYAQRKMQEYKAEGLSELEAREKVSYKLGHHRPEIINIYLGATNNSKASKIHAQGTNKSKKSTLKKNKK